MSKEKYIPCEELAFRIHLAQEEEIDFILNDADLSEEDKQIARKKQFEIRGW